MINFNISYILYNISIEKKNKKTYEPILPDPHPHGRYEDAAYHTAQGNKIKSARPIDGQKALDISIPYETNRPHRIAVYQDQFVVLFQTLPGLYHGHVRSWNELEPNMQKALRKKNLVRKNGKIKT